MLLGMAVMAVPVVRGLEVGAVFSGRGRKK